MKICKNDTILCRGLTPEGKDRVQEFVQTPLKTNDYQKWDFGWIINVKRLVELWQLKSRFRLNYDWPLPWKILATDQGLISAKLIHRHLHHICQNIFSYYNLSLDHSLSKQAYIIFLDFIHYCLHFTYILISECECTLPSSVKLPFFITVSVVRTWNFCCDSSHLVIWIF
jgi:hypothetical protein